MVRTGGRPKRTRTSRYLAGGLPVWDYRRQLETAIAFFDRQDPVPPARTHLQASLDAVLREQDERARIAHAR